MIEDPIVFCDSPRHREINLRADGITCITAVGMSVLHEIQKEPPLHFHPEVMEFCLCIKGNLTFETDKGEYKFLPGQIFASSPKEPHHLKNNPKGLKIYRLVFRIPHPGECILGLDARESEWLARSLMNLPKRVFMSTPQVKESFDRIFDLYDHARASPARRVRMKTAAQNLLVAIVDAARKAPMKVPEKIDQMARRIRNYPEGDYPVAAMAKEVQLSPSAFSDLFKKSVGLPLHAYLIDSRILKAKKLLENTDRPIADIAAELRFSSVPHFASTFKRVVGTTPCILRKELALARGGANGDRRRARV